MMKIQSTNQEVSLIRQSSTEPNPQTATNCEIQLGYWPFAGRHMPVVFILELLEIPYEPVVFEPESWFGKQRDALELSFPGLPYLIDTSTGIKITEVHNIVNYVLFKAKRNRDFSRIEAHPTCNSSQKSPKNINSTTTSTSKPFEKHQLESSVSYSQLDDFRIDEIRFILNDSFTQIASAIAKQPSENSIKHMQDTVLPKMNVLQQYIEQSNAATISRTTFFIMGYFSIVDTYFYIISKYFETYFPSLYEAYAPVFDLLRESFEAIPQIQKYIESEQFPRLG